MMTPIRKERGAQAGVEQTRSGTGQALSGTGQALSGTGQAQSGAARQRAGQSRWTPEFRKAFWLCAILCVVTACITFGMFVIRDGGLFVVRGDFDEQQIPFTMALHNSLRDGNLGGWTWNLDLGTSTLTGFSFYKLGSPFFWLAMLFPASWFPYLIAWIYVLKYTVAGLTAYVFISRFVTDRKYAVAGALVYAFSGFQTTNLVFYHFHDVVAFFPLLLDGLEELKEKKRTRYFIFTIFLNCLVNYFFFVMEVIFLVIYYLFRFCSRTLKENGLKGLVLDLLRCIGCGIAGVAMAAVLFVPSLYYLTEGSRSSMSFYLSEMFPSPRQVFFILKAWLLPGESMKLHSAVYVEEWKSAAGYLPLVGLTGVIAYIRGRKDCLQKLMILLMIISFMPLPSAGFLVFTASYQRWWYMLLLLMAMATAVVLDRREAFDIRGAAVINGAAIVVFAVLVRYVRWSASEGPIVNTPKRFLAYAAISLAGVGLFAFISCGAAVRKRMLLLLICGFAGVTTAMTLHFYRIDTYSADDMRELLSLGSQLTTEDPQYRYRTGNNILTLGGDLAGTSSFSSTVTTSIWDFDGLFGFYHAYDRMTKENVKGLSELLGGRYEVSKEKPADREILKEIVADGNTWYLSEVDACPIGYAVDRYIRKDELMNLEVGRRGEAMLQAVVVDGETETAVAGELDQMSAEDVLENSSDGAAVDTGAAASADIKPLIAANQAAAVSNFSRDTKGFTCTTSYDKDRRVWFSVPYSTGWSAAVDGEAVDILESGSMMLIKVPAGEHAVEFHFETPLYKVSLLISLAAILGFAASCLAARRRKH